ncbi:MAG: hypothetical protein JWM78_2091 [Verrucomicrobiaceae bacterium]|nr:hypothetical protein [Verrucomicrobiaceae bacterium]
MIRPLFVFVVICTSLFANAHAAENSAQPLLREQIEQLRNSPQTLHIVGDLTLAQAVADIYQHNNFNLIWVTRARLQSLVGAIATITTDGLNPDDYHLAQLQQGLEHLSESELLAQRVDFDLLASDAYIRALTHLWRGKVDPKKLDLRSDFLINDLSAEQALQIINDGIDTHKIAETFALARPQHNLYVQMRNTLATLRALAAHGGWPQIAEGPTLKIDMHDARVPLLRQRLIAAGITVADDSGDLYDAALATAVKQFQREQLISADGAIGNGTRTALNISVQQRVEQQRADLERARWLLHGVQGNFVVVNAASYKVSFYRGDILAWTARVQVGTPVRDTPIFKSMVTRITFNPNWTVPPTIFTKDILPKIKHDPAYLQENNIHVFDSQGQPLNAAQIDWKKPGNIILRQDAGPHSALGRAAIRFDNTFAIYLHDTPHQDLFTSNNRAFSSGCIRVERALELVELLLDDNTAWNRTAIDAEIATEKTHNVSVAHRIPILLTYWTVNSDETGHITFMPDFYARNEKLLRLLNSHQ